MKRLSPVMTMYLAAASLLALFVWLAVAVRTGLTQTADRQILLDIHKSSRGLLDEALRMLTTLGAWPMVLGFGLVLIIALWQRQRPALAAAAGAILIGSLLLDLWFKQLFDRLRPDLWAPLVHESSRAFPSGHATASFSLACIAVYLAWPSRWRRLVIIISLMYVLTIGFSRLYLGVHYPSDVVGGWLLAGTWALLVISLHSGRRRYTV